MAKQMMNDSVFLKWCCGVALSALTVANSHGALVHRWSISETSGTNLLDSVGTANAWVVVTNGGGGFSLDGRRIHMDGGARNTADYVRFPTNTFAGLSNVTVEIWATPHSFPNWGRVFEIGPDENTAPEGKLVRVAFSQGTNGEAQRYGLYPTTIDATMKTPVDREYHYVMTWSAEGSLSFYRDGVLIGTQNTAPTNIASVSAQPNMSFWLARSHFTADSTANASYNEVRVYDSVLDAATIQSDFRRGCEDTFGLLHRWSFSETSGTNLADSVCTAAGSVVSLSGTFLLGGGQVALPGGTRASADYVAFPSRRFDGLTDMTIEVWATQTAAQNWSRVFDVGDGVTPGTSFFLSFTKGADINQQRLEFLPGGTADSALPTTLNQQYYYAITWDQTAGKCSWYRSGQFVTSFNLGSQTLANVTNAVFWLARSHYGADSTASAKFNEVRLYNRALLTNEIAYHFQQGPDDISLPPPVASNDFMTLNPGAKALIPVLDNDASVQSDPASIVIVTAPASGTAQVKSDGKILYTHSGAPGASDSFTYTYKDIFGRTSSVATVSLTINPALRLPNTTITIPGAPPPVSYQVVDAFPGVTFNQPLAMRTPPVAVYSNLLFVAERRGNITYIDVTATNLVKQTFLSIPNQVAFDNSAVDGELGLLSMDFHPGFATNGIFFVSYIAPGSPYLDRLSRFTADPNTLTVNTNTQQILFSMPDREFNHNGSDLHFGPDGYLYMSMGDEGGQYNVHLNAQRLDNNLYSGLLRLDVDKRPGSVEPTPHPGIPTDGAGHAFYSIPPDNPFLGVTNLYGTSVDTNKLRGEFYAIGFRHPWRFSFDSQTGELWVGDVGQDKYEEVETVRKGGNYGWPYYEATHATPSLYPGQPGMMNPPSGYVSDQPLWEYPHTSVAGSDPQFSGLDVCGSLVYHGSRIPALTNAYLFGDFDAGGNIWALRRLTNNTVTVERLAGQPGLAAFGADPHNGDLLMANYLQNKLQRLVLSDLSSGFPTKLSDTGIFADLATLTPNPGIVSYEPNVAFWSDYALKQRWFTIPDTTKSVGFTSEGGWSLPTGMMWIKHFDLELERGNPATKRRIETRVLVKTDTSVYGVSYKWNDAQDDASLVPDAGDFFPLTVTNNGVAMEQDWEIPSRSSCLACHTSVGGQALTFNTRQMNKTFTMNGLTGNQISLMSDAGYFSAPVSNVQSLPAHAIATDESISLEHRVRSYLAVNCSQCHQAGGSCPGWDARPNLTLAETKLINGTPTSGDGGNPANKLIVPGDTNHSVVLLRLENANGFSRMPPLATHQLDPESINLVARWISSDLTNYQDFAAWQIATFGSTNNPLAAPDADPDNDGANNYYEFLTMTSPLTNNPSPWKLEIAKDSTNVDVSFLRLANRGFLIESSPDFTNWSFWNAPGNQLFFGASSIWDTVSGPLLPGVTNEFFRAHIFEP